MAAHPGDLDPSFGTGGKVTTGVGYASAIVLQGDGKIVAAGHTDTGPRGAFALAHYNPNGSLDPTFGARGMVTTAFGTSYDGAYAVALQGDGKIVAAGSTQVATQPTVHTLALARYNSDGGLDETFGTGGRVTTAFGTSDSSANAIALQGDGKIVAAGVTEAAPGAYAFVLARYNPDGNLDASFGTGGTVTTAFGTIVAEAFAVALQGDGRIVAAG